LGGDASRERLNALATGKADLSTRAAATAALASLDLQQAASRAVEILKQHATAEQTGELIQAFIARKEGANALAAALAEIQLPPDAAKLTIRAARSTAQPDQALIDALTAAGGLAAATAVTPELVQALDREVRAHGNAARGETIFRGSQQACLKCHAIAGAGGQVGPDLVSIGASAQIDYLIESILLPNKAVKENYHSVVVAMDDGRVLTGVKVRQTGDQLILRDAEDREVAVPLASIMEQSPGASLMPLGLVDSLTRSELVDLVRFLSELGKAGPYAVGNARVVRRWQMLDATPEGISAASNGIDAAVRNEKLPWIPAYSRVAGELPLESVPLIDARANKPPLGLVRFMITASQAGPVKLKFNATKGLTMWLDGAAHLLLPETTVDLSQGAHTLAISVDPAARVDGLRIELVDIPGSPAQVQLQGGK